MRRALTAAWNLVLVLKKVSQERGFLSQCFERVDYTLPSSSLLANELAEEEAGWGNRKIPASL